jgi:hypothetical protein
MLSYEPFQFNKWHWPPEAILHKFTAEPWTASTPVRQHATAGIQAKRVEDSFYSVLNLRGKAFRGSIVLLRITD